MKKKVLSFLLIFVFAFSMVLPTYAGTKDDLQNELSGIENQQNEVSNRLAEVESDIESLNAKLSALNNDIAAANQKISETEDAIFKKQEDMQNREDGLNERLRVMYKNGSIGFVDVLLGSNSVSEFISNLELIQKIYKNDMDVLKTLKQEAAELEQIKKDLEAEKQNLAEKKKEADSDKAELDSLKAELKAKEDQLAADADRIAGEIANMVDKDSDYVGGGSWVWPAPASRWITSPFGWRNHPVYGGWVFHSGVDIGASYGTNILAATSGTVILSQEYGGYGECIVIDHGGGIATLYGHMSERLVRAGQKVNAGSVIGRVGSTGISSGPHLHFEVQKGGEPVNPLDYVS